MKRPALFAVVAMAASTATAQPKQEVDDGRVSYTGAEPRADDDGWVQLTSPTPVEHGTEYIVVDPDAGHFTRLRVDAHSGTVAVVRLRLFFADGTARNIPVGKSLDGERRSTVIEIPASKRIRTIGVTTVRSTGGAYTLHASSGVPAVARR
jgi:hypothetical protein